MDEEQPTKNGDEQPAPAEPVVAAPRPPEGAKEVSAATIGRMMGLATVSDLKLLDSKVDLLATKVTGMVIKLEKVLSILGNAPSGSDLERIDVQIGGLRTIIREAMQTLQEVQGPPKE